MPLSFPSSPTLGQTYTFNSYSWRWDGERWAPILFQGASGATGATGPLGATGIGSTGATGSTGPGQFTFGNTAPVSPNFGDRWLDTVNMIDLIYVTDGDSAQWVEFAGRSSSGVTRSLNNLSNVAVNTNLVPNADQAYDLGSNLLRWRDLYLSGNTLYLGNAVVTASGNTIVLPTGTTVQGGSAFGATGATGVAGSPGTNGANGATGATGPEGPASISDGAGNSFPTGYKAMPQSTNVTGTLVASDAGKHLYINTNIIIPANSTVPFPVGTVITFIANGASITITPTVGMTLRLVNSSNTGSRTLASHGMAGIVKVATDTWYISGNGLS